MKNNNPLNRNKLNLIIAAIILAVLFVGLPFGSGKANSALAPTSAFAGVGVADENSETVFTASPDGKVIYMWQYFSSKPPKYLGKAEAIESQ